MTNQLKRAEVYDHLARLEREGHPRPWEAFEFLGTSLKWFPVRSIEELIRYAYITGIQVRPKPQLPPMVERTIRYPEPRRRRIAPGQQIYVPDPLRTGYTFSCTWQANDTQRRWLHAGLIHLIERNARAHGMALAGCSQENIDAVLREED